MSALRVGGWRGAVFALCAGCAPVMPLVGAAGPKPSCYAGGVPDSVILVDVPATVTTPATQMWLCYTPNEFSATPELARAGVFTWMAEGHIWRGDIAGALQLYEHAYTRMPDPKRRAAIAFELARRYKDPQIAVKWLWRAIDYVDVSAEAGEEYQALAGQIRAQLERAQ